MKQPIKWIYFYTEDYGFWHKHLTDALSSKFNTRPILISPISAHGKSGSHHFKGISKKIQLVIDSIEENIGSSIIFSDCTLWINEKKSDNLKNFTESFCEKYDIVFADNALDRSANIGMMLIQCNERTLTFFKNALRNFTENSWDQGLINQMLPGAWILRSTRIRILQKFRYFYQSIMCHFRPTTISWSFFDSDKIVCAMNFPEKLRESCLVYKQFINPSDPKNNWNERLNRLHMNGFINSAELKKNLR